MAEYIEREALMYSIKEIHCAECDYYHGVRCRACWVDDALDCIDSEPAADVAPVVRCKDCKHYGGVAFGNVCRRWSAPLAGMKNCTKPDDFCSCGERRTDNG